MLSKFTNLFDFFTTWNTILVVFHRYTHAYIDLEYLSFVTLLGGLYLSFVNPKRFVFKMFGKKYYVNGIIKFIFVDIIFHLCVFLFVYSHHHSYYKQLHVYNEKIITAFMMLCVYAIVIDCPKVYGIPMDEIVRVYAGSTLAFVVFKTLL
jgi:hypothetical protein